MKNSIDRDDYITAKKILIKHNWISKYYYIMKVLNSTRYTGRNVNLVLATKKWGINTLERELNFIFKKYKNNIIYLTLDIIKNEYIETIRETSDEIINSWYN